MILQCHQEIISVGIHGQLLPPLQYLFMLGGRSHFQSCLLFIHLFLHLLCLFFSVVVSFTGIHAYEINLLLLKDEIILVLLIFFTSLLLLLPRQPRSHLSLPLLPQLLLTLFHLWLHVPRGQQILPPLSTRLSLLLLVISVKLIGKSVKSIRLLGSLGIIIVHMAMLSCHSQYITLKLQLSLLLLGNFRSTPQLANDFFFILQLTFQ
mmetsp:Transcript_12434/g.27180  ORF Transcript_12434/g.27180 Transcript_12434/m.27180 type:complete len:207 (-) Transcript_12434:1410-2030(-)